MKRLIITLLMPLGLLMSVQTALGCADHDDIDYEMFEDEDYEVISHGAWMSVSERATDSLNLAQLTNPGTTVTVTTWMEPKPAVFVSRHPGVRVTVLSVELLERATETALLAKAR